MNKVQALLASLQRTRRLKRAAERDASPSPSRSRSSPANPVHAPKVAHHTKRARKKARMEMRAAAMASDSQGESHSASEGEEQEPPPAAATGAAAAAVKAASEHSDKAHAQHSAASGIFAAISSAHHAALHFAKIAPQFRFNNTAAAFLQWSVRFKIELRSLDLEGVVATNPTQLAHLAPDVQQAEDKRQQAVYGMILKCVPEEVMPTLTSAMPIGEQTGFHAWETLRLFYLGEPQKYLQTLERKFHDLRWEDAESFMCFEARFQSLLGELDAMGAHKLDAARKSQLLLAVELSNHKDSRGVHVFDRLNIAAKINSDLPFAGWLAALRTEAQEIEQSFSNAHNKSKRAREEQSQEERQVKDVSFVGPAGPGPMRNSFHGGRRNMQAAHVRKQLFNPRSHRQEGCRDFLLRGRCAYGENCRYSHSQPSSSGGHGGQQAAHGGQAQQRDQTCYQFKATGQCTRLNCRFSHSRAAAEQHGAAGAGGTGGASSRDANTRFGADAFVIERANAVFKGGEEEEPVHRVLLDSCDSIHLTPKQEFVTNLRLLERPVWVRGAFGEPVECRYGGEGAVPVGEHVLRVGELVYCPQLRDTLLSMVKLAREGYTFDLQSFGGTLTPNTRDFTLAISYAGEIFTLEQLASEEQHRKAEANVTTRAARRREDEAAEHLVVQEQEEQKEQLDSRSSAAQASTAASATAKLAHARYGHLCGRKLGQLFDFQAAEGLLPAGKHSSHSSLIRDCDACMRAKMSRSKFGKAIEHHAHAPNDAVAADVCGPIWTERRADGTEVKHSASIIVDLYSRRVNLRVVQRKSEASHHARSYFFSSETETGNKLRRFHADGGKEYNEVERFLEAKGVKVTRTPAYTPQHNGVAERKNRTLLETTRALLEHAGLDPARYWQDALHTAVYLHNRVIVVAEHGKTPHELYTGQRPDLSGLRVFGCDAWVHIPEVKRPGKLEGRAEKGVFVGYDLKKELSYRILVKDEQGERIVVTRDVEFKEDQFTVDRESGVSESAAAANSDERNTSIPPLAHRIEQFFQAASSSSSSQSASDDEQEADELAQSGGDEEPLDKRTLRAIQASERRAEAHAAPSSAGGNTAGRPARARKPARQTGLNPDDFGQFVLATTVVEQPSETSAPSEHKIRQSDVSIPSTRRAALRSPYAREWQAAMEAEMQSIRAHDTFSLTPRPVGVNVVSCKWVFAVKAKDGWVSRFKARLVARGFSQQLGVDYEETYAPVLKYKTLRLLLALIAAKDLCFELMDVQTAYLNAPLKETVYMQQPEGFEQGGASVVCLLKRAIYGLKQAGREWNATLNDFILGELGFTRCVNEPCLYYKRSRSGRLIIVSVYVDDIPSAFHDEDRAEWEEIKAAFFKRFAIKFLGEADWLLNMRITRDRSRRLLFLDQQAYCESMLEDLQMDDCKPLAHPGAPEELSKAGCPAAPEGPEQQRQQRQAQGQYRRAVGLLTYLANTSRPDIAHSVHLVAQFAQNPGAIHFRAVKAILRYLGGTAAYALVFDGRTSGEAEADAQSAGARAGEAAGSEFKNSGSNLALTVYADANWGGCKDSRRSTTGYLIALGRSWIDWNSHKQPTVALSSCEAEYMALTAAATGVKWTVKLLREIGVLEDGEDGVQKSPVPILLSDNKAAIALAKNDVHHSRSKHIDIRHHFIRDEILGGRISLQWVSSGEQVADILTKTLLPKTFLKLRAALVAPRATLEKGAQKQQQTVQGDPTHTQLAQL